MRLYNTLFSLALLVLSPSAFAIRVYSIPTQINIDTSKVTAIVGPIDDAMVASVAIQLQSNKDLPGDRVVLIQSPGGSVPASEKIITLLENEQRKGIKLHCVVLRAAHSAAFNILSHCDARYATSGSQMLVHRIAIAGADERLTSVNLRKIADEIDAINLAIDQFNAKKMGLSLAEYVKKADAETIWPALDLVKLGYLRGIVNVD
jgi:ATP-dependent protease ClpP protease subunit